jgi:YfiH family protein
MVTPAKPPLRASALTGLAGIAHGFFTRQGGVSSGIYESLNCGAGSSDDAAAVKENRARVAEELGVDPSRLITPSQKHSAIAAIANAPWTGGAPEADAVVTATPGLAVGVVTADCAPVLFCDPQARIVAAAHAGWRGALAGILENTVEAMISLGADPARIVAAIGPTISQSAYEVGSDYRDAFLEQDPKAAEFFAVDDSTLEPHFDLPAYAAERLQRAGIGEIVDLAFCTYCDEARLFSYRRSQHWGEADYGRQISAIVLV